jgi:pyruvate formate lyase activating enzyme
MGQIYEITPFSLLDYPGEMSCIVWFAGCNMRCVYCHNPQIVTGSGHKEVTELLDFLQKRIGKLTAVVFSGGEATLYHNLVDLVRKVKVMGFKIKLDTNGSRPEVLDQLIKENLLDYVAMDFKCLPELAKHITGTSKFWNAFTKSMKLLNRASEHGVHFELRTTVHPDFLDEKHINQMISYLEESAFKGKYYIQKIVATGDKTIGNIPSPVENFDVKLINQPKGFPLSFRNFS